MSLKELKELLRQEAPSFWERLDAQTLQAAEFDELVFLSTLRKKALARGLPGAPSNKPELRLAILGGCSLYPLRDLLANLLEASGLACSLFIGEYDNYIAEIMEPSSALYLFRPQAVLILPSGLRCKHPGALTDSPNIVRDAAVAVASQLLDLCNTLHAGTDAEVLLGNFMLPARHDLGAFRAKAAASDWSFRKYVNLELGMRAPPFVRICDLEFLGNRRGALEADAGRGWFESKQPCSPAMLVDLSREAAHLLVALRTAPKKVLVLDLDNTLWGGVIGDDGLAGIEIGDTSPRGEAFKAFQRSVLALKERGVLLAVCSKNDPERAREPFEKHPEMILRLDDFVSFKANWEPKSDNLRRMAQELNLGLDSFVFIDDNPAEINIVQQFVPEVATVLLGSDPADYAGQLQDCRLFEPRAITDEDQQRTKQYRAQDKRAALLSSATDMDAYLASLKMQARVEAFAPVDVPRISQLINKSNQFNLTTRRRTEAEVQSLIGNIGFETISVRLKDRFGDHGLIAVVIAKVSHPAFDIDTWLMSCRVLNRQVEDLILNELCRIARARGCTRLEGVYLATAKNDMVRDFYSRIGFTPRSITAERSEFVQEVASYGDRATKISIEVRT